MLCQIIIFVFALTRFNFFNIKSTNEGLDEYLVIQAKEDYVIVLKDKVKYIYYIEGVKENNRLLIYSDVEMLDETSEFNRYLKTQNIHYVVKGPLIANSRETSLRNKIVEFLLKDKDEDNKRILKLILFNEKDDTNKGFYGYFQTFSITFMLVISGYHINLIFKVLKRKHRFKYIFAFLYLYLLDFSISSYKAFLYFCLKKINKKFKLVFNNSDLLTFVMISFLFINPSYAFNKGFIYSFFFSFVVDIVNNTFYEKRLTHKILKKITIYLFSFPLILNDTYQWNTNSFLANVLFEYPVSLLFVFSFIYLFFDKFYLVYKIYIHFLKLILNFLDRHSLNLIFGKPNYIMMIVLFLLLLLFLYLYQNKLFKHAVLCISLFVMCCFVQYLYPYISARESVYFLDVGQGDCMVLKIKHSKKVVLIDTGGSRYQDIANKKIIPFLKRNGINQIEKIIITHDDFDHNGAKDALIENFNVNEIIESSFVEYIDVGQSRFKNLNVNQQRDNDGSIVLYGEYGGIKYLFTGDISSIKEKEIISANKDIIVDVLKVSHHGANTSTCDELLNHIRGKIAIISVGKNNLYKHPHPDVIERLNNYGYFIYSTNEKGSIEIYKNLISGKFIINSS